MDIEAELNSFARNPNVSVLKMTLSRFQRLQELLEGGAFDSAKNRKRQSVNAKREKLQKPKFVTAKR